MEPSEIREIALKWLYDRALVTSLPQLETAMLNGIRREGTEIQLPQLREAIDFLTDKGFVRCMKPKLGGSRSNWGWNITADGKTAREEMP